MLSLEKVVEEVMQLKHGQTRSLISEAGVSEIQAMLNQKAPGCFVVKSSDLPFGGCDITRVRATAA